MERYGAWANNHVAQMRPEVKGDWIRYADAQDTVEALQARVSELQGVADEKCRCFLERAEQAEKQLTQRTAEVEALQRERDEAIERVETHSTLRVENMQAALAATRQSIECKAALDAEREKVKGLEALQVGFDGQDEVLDIKKSDYYALRDELSQLQALVRKFVDSIQPVDCVEVDELLKEARATLDATTPARRNDESSVDE